MTLKITAIDVATNTVTLSGPVTAGEDVEFALEPGDVLAVNGYPLRVGLEVSGPIEDFMGDALAARANVARFTA